MLYFYFHFCSSFYCWNLFEKQIGTTGFGCDRKTAQRECFSLLLSVHIFDMFPEHLMMLFHRLRAKFSFSITHPQALSKQHHYQLHWISSSWNLLPWLSTSEPKSSEIQDAGARSRFNSNSNPSLFASDHSINHLLNPVLNTSIKSILQAVSPRTLQRHYTTWKSFKALHLSYNLPFPDFSLLYIMSFFS